MHHEIRRKLVNETLHAPAYKVQHGNYYSLVNICGNEPKSDMSMGSPYIFEKQHLQIRWSVFPIGMKVFYITRRCNCWRQATHHLKNKLQYPFMWDGLWESFLEAYVFLSSVFYVFFFPPAYAPFFNLQKSDEKRV